MNDWTPKQKLLAEARRRGATAARAVLDELQDVLDERDLQELLGATGIEHMPSAEGVSAVLARVQGPGGAAGPQGSGQSSAMADLRVRLVGGREVWLMADPWDDALVQRLNAPLGRYVEPMAATGQLLRRLGTQAASGGESGDLADAPRRADHRPEALSLPEPAADSVTNLAANSVAEGDVVDFVNRTIRAAFDEGASDIHFECDRTGVTAKLRLDGVMRNLSRLPGRQPAEEVVSRIKVLAQLDITERRLPQDGRFRHEGLGQGLDLRVSIMPSVFGEDAVLRLLDKSQLRTRDAQVSLDGLGFDAGDVKRIRMLSNLPNGMLLVTGPTGSGKTTTVYATLSEINTGLEKIITIEDPVEYELPGVLQIPVNERKGLTFAKGLRSILRHDPDRILVGEIRDAETAEIAVQSALTGHLVFTTVHANSLFDVIGRFRHFGIDMFGFVSSLNGVVVQRLVRRLCPACAGTRAPSADEQVWLDERQHAAVAGMAEQPRIKILPQAQGCGECRHSGYRGRFVIAEVHQMSDAFRDLIMRHADVTELKKVAFADQRLKPLITTALAQVAAGRTTLEEVFRVVGQI